MCVCLLCQFYSTKDTDDVEAKCRALYSSFVRAAHADLRCLGAVIVEAYLRRPLTTFERANFRKSHYVYDNLCQTYEMSRMTKGMKQLLQLCFSPVSSVLLEETENPQQGGKRDIRAPLLQHEEEILCALGSEFWGMFGGIGSRWGTLGDDRPKLWTKEDQVRVPILCVCACPCACVIVSRQLCTHPLI